MTILEAVGPGVAVLGLGCVLLLWGAEEFMEHLGAVAALTGIPVLALGLLLAGAEPEELATALIASSQGHPVLAATDATQRMEMRTNSIGGLDRPAAHGFGGR